MAVWTRRRRLMCGTTRRTGPTRRGSGMRLSGPWSTSWPGTGPCSPTPGSSRPTASTASPARCPRVPLSTRDPGPPLSPGQPGRDAVQDEVDVPHDLVLLADVLGLGDELNHPGIAPAVHHDLHERGTLLHDLF